LPEHRDSAAVFGDFSSKDVDTLSDDNSCAKKKMRGERKGAGASEGVSEEIRIDRSMNAGANKAHDEQGQNGKGERKDGRKEVEPRERRSGHPQHQGHHPGPERFISSAVKPSRKVQAAIRRKALAAVDLYSKTGSDAGLAAFPFLNTESLKAKLRGPIVVPPPPPSAWGDARSASKKRRRTGPSLGRKLEEWRKGERPEKDLFQ